MGATLQLYDLDEWFQSLLASNVCIGKVRSFPEEFYDPHHLDTRNNFTDATQTLGEVLQIGVKLKLSQTPAQVRTLDPWKVKHSEEFIGEPGHTEDSMSRMKIKKARWKMSVLRSRIYGQRFRGYTEKGLHPGEFHALEPIRLWDCPGLCQMYASSSAVPFVNFKAYNGYSQK